MSYRRALLAAAVAAGVVGAPGVAGAVATPGASPVGPTVTLLTGDVVTIGGMYGVTVRAAKGREHLSFVTRKDEQGDLHVIPEDAAVPLQQGRLDPRLFDVTELVEAGYDDASRDRLPLIVDYPGGTSRMAGVRVTRDLPAVGAAAVSAERTADFWTTARNAEHIWLDGPVRASLDHSVPQIGAPEAWASGHTGNGTTVAVLDTGIDGAHPDLSDAVTAEENFTDSDSTDDRFGHGTHVASIITGSGAASGGRYRGVAPDTKLLNGKVLDDFGGGFESWIIAGMEWAARSGADVVNMSLGSRLPSDGTDPMSQAVNRLTAETGALFVVAAGNDGFLVGSPAAADAALTVGAVDRDDQLADFSNRGRLGDVIKPDITAPGVDIVAAKAKNGWIGTPAGDGYVSLSGTSMATPHVAGAAAILAGQHPDWTADQLKSTLMGSAKPTGGVSVFEQGAGRVDVARAATATVSASPASISNGVVRWPHDDDAPIATTITYTNSGSAPVTLDLAAPAYTPRGMFTVEPAQLTVPAGGRATATVTTDTGVDATDGVHSGAITATGGGQSVRTPIAVTREVESYDVTMRFVDHDGAPTGGYGYRFVDVAKPVAYLWKYDPSGTLVERLPKGEYYLEAFVETEIAESDYRVAWFGEPAFTVTGDAEIVLDARAAKPVGFTVDEPNTRGGDGMFQFALETAWGDTGITAIVGGSFDDITVRPSTTSKKDRFTFSTEARMARWNGESFDGSPYLYHLRHTENGAIPRTLWWPVRNRELAKVRSKHAAATPGTIGVREGFVTLPLPGTLTEYYTPNVPWTTSFMEMTGPDAYPPVSMTNQVEPRIYQRGRVTTERWNVGVYGPSFPNYPYAASLAGRLGDELRFDLPLASDQGRGRGGFATATGTTTLMRDGVVIGEEAYPGYGSFRVGPERATYTLSTTANRPAPARLSTQISAEWTFTSAHVAGEEPAALPLLAVRFAPDLDDGNAAPAGRRFTIPVSADRAGTTDEAARVHTLMVEVSYDDGVTWQPAKVKRDHGRWQATLDHPAGAEFVSLRSTVVGAEGTQHLTIIRAYALK